jgi:Protein of unknown function (DUF3040)
MLGREDERRLAAIEQQLLRDDPAFVRRLTRRHLVVTRSTWRKLGAAGSGCLCALATVVVLLAGLGALTMLFLVTVAACTCSVAAGVPVVFASHLLAGEARAAIVGHRHESESGEGGAVPAHASAADPAVGSPGTSRALDGLHLRRHRQGGGFHVSAAVAAPCT